MTITRHGFGRRAWRDTCAQASRASRHRRGCVLARAPTLRMRAPPETLSPPRDDHPCSRHPRVPRRRTRRRRPQAHRAHLARHRQQPRRPRHRRQAHAPARRARRAIADQPIGVQRHHDDPVPARQGRGREADLLRGWRRRVLRPARGQATSRDLRVEPRRRRVPRPQRRRRRMPAQRKKLAVVEVEDAPVVEKLVLVDHTNKQAPFACK